MATNRLGSSHITFFIAWKGLWARSVSRSNLRYELVITHHLGLPNRASICLNTYQTQLSPLSNHFGSWLMLVFGPFTRFVHRSQLSARSFRRLTRIIVALRHTH